MIMVQSVMHPHVLILTMLIAIVAAQCVGKIKRGDACRETSECRRNLVCNNWTNGSKLCQPAKCSVEGERCGWYRGSCCQNDPTTYCYKKTCDQSRCTRLQNIPEQDRDKVQAGGV